MMMSSLSEELRQIKKEYGITDLEFVHVFQNPDGKEMQFQIISSVLGYLLTQMADTGELQRRLKDIEDEYDNKKTRKNSWSEITLKL